MFKIIVFMHGDLAKSLKETAELISGSNDQVEYFGVPLGCDTGAVLNQVSASIKEAGITNLNVLVLTDLFSGILLHGTCQMTGWLRFLTSGMATGTIL